MNYLIQQNRASHLPLADFLIQSTTEFFLETNTGQPPVHILPMNFLINEQPSASPQNLFTVDLENWFCSHNLADAVPFSTWDELENRVAPPTFRLLDLLEKYQVQAVFFVLGWTAERNPSLIREISARSHEIATHGFSHRQITKMSPAEFEDDLVRSLEILQPLAKNQIRGFRAPAFSVTSQTIWALKILEKYGLTFDSSIYPTAMNPDYGIADAPLHPFKTQNGLLELPLSVATFGKKRVPCSGGGYLRLLPYPIFKKLAKRCNSQGRPFIFYIHPWELDPGFPKIGGLAPLKKWRHYQNLDTTFSKIERLLTDFRFGTIDRFFPLSPPSLASQKMEGASDLIRKFSF